MIEYLNPRTASADEIAEWLDEAIAEMRDRTQDAANGREFTSADAYELVLDHAEEVLGNARINDRVVLLARFGRKVKVKVHLIVDRKLSDLTPADFGSAILRALADFGGAILRDLAAQDRAAVTVTDQDGRTLSELFSRAG